MTIRKIKVSALPEATTLVGLNVLGVDGSTNGSVKVPIDLLKGNNLELQKTSTHVQWRAVGGNWANLVALTEINNTLTMQSTGSSLQWKSGTGEWQTLVSFADLHQIATDAAATATTKAGEVAAAEAVVIAARDITTGARDITTGARDVTVAAKDITVTKASEAAASKLAAATSETNSGNSAAIATSKAAQAAASAAAAALGAAQFPNGTWNAATNTTTPGSAALVNGTGTAGWWYMVSVAGTALGQTFIEGDMAFYNGSTWVRIPNAIIQMLNDQWLTATDYAGNLISLLKLNKDNVLTFGVPVALDALFHVMNPGLNEMVNIPVNANSPAGTEHGVWITIGGVRIAKFSALSDGAGGVKSPQLFASGYTSKTQALTYAVSLAVDFNNGSDAVVTLTGNVTLALANVPDGASGTITTIQGTGGSKLLTAITHAGLTVQYRGGTSLLTTVAGKADKIRYERTGSILYITIDLNY